MLHTRALRRPLVACLALAASGAALLASTGGADEPIVPLRADAKRGIVMPYPSVVRLLGYEKVRAYGGRDFISPVVEHWRPICGSDPRVFAPGVLESCIGDIQPAEGEEAGEVIEVNSSQSLVGLDLSFTVSGVAPAGAASAIAAVEQAVEPLFANPVSIRIAVQFTALPAGVLGSTGTTYYATSLSDGCAAIADGRDANDEIASWMPAGATVGVRYANTPTVTQEDRVFWTHANTKAAVGDVAGIDATIRFNSSIPWDFNPADGVTGYSFRDVLAHEVGHALGIGSGIDFLANDITVMDLFRFPQVDGNGGFNPRTYAEFRVRPRLAAFNAPNDQQVLNLVSMQVPMSDGSPFQASHLRQQAPSLGLMSPTLAPGTTRAPFYFGARDLAILDAVGWNR